MTDLEIIRAMLQRAGLVFTESPAPLGGPSYRANVEAGDISLTLAEAEEQPEHLKHGYWGFYAEFVFWPDGSLKTIGAWE